jgi:hypothetical protein
MGDNMNAKEEFLRVTKDYKVICAKIRQGDNDDDKWTMLMPNYTQEQLDAFLKEIDFVYDSGYGGQELFGLILCEDDVWFDRGEYDGSEWWEKHSYPDMAEEFYNL